MNKILRIDNRNYIPKQSKKFLNRLPKNQIKEFS